MVLATPIAILVGFRASQIILELNSMNYERKLRELTIAALKEQIVQQLNVLLKVYRDTTPNVNLANRVNLADVNERVLNLVISERSPLEEKINSLNSIYVDLIYQGTQSEYFIQVLQFLGV